MSSNKKHPENSSEPSDSKSVELEINDNEEGEEKKAEENAEAPLEKNCCGLFHYDFWPPGIEVKTFVPLLMLLLSEGITGPSMSSYSSYLIVDVGAVSDIDDAGNYSGLLISSFFICQFVSALVLGTLSDKYGRKPFLIISGFLGGAFQIAFGFSKKIWQAILFRALCGLCNGSVGIAKTAIADITNKANRIKAFTFIGLMFGFGSIIGSAIAGFTARPAVEYPETFSADGFFGKYPYALPNLIIGAYTLVAAFIALFALRETHPAIVRRKKGEEVDMSAFPTINIDIVDMNTGAFSYGTAHVVTEEAMAEEKIPDIIFEAEKYEKEMMAKADLRGKIKRLKLPILATAVYTCSSLLQFIYVTIISVWTVATPDVGGLDFSTLMLGIFTAADGVCVILIILFLSERIITFLTPVWSNRLVGIYLLPISCCAPLANNILRKTGNKVGMWAYLIIIAFLWQIATQVMMNASLGMISNSVHPMQIGRWNGISQGAGSIARALSPVTISLLLSWSFEEGRKFPFNYFFSFFINAIVCIILLIFAFILPKEIDIPYIQRYVEERELAGDPSPVAEAMKKKNLEIKC